jgi:hypothetical protein
MKASAENSNLLVSAVTELVNEGTVLTFTFHKAKKSQLHSRILPLSAYSIDAATLQRRAGRRAD